MRERSWLYSILRWPVSWLTRFQAIADPHNSTPSAPDHVVYVMPAPSSTDLVVARNVCEKLGLPDPTSPLTINGREFPRVLFIEDPRKRLKYPPREPFNELLKLHQNNSSYNVHMYPLGLFWGREPGREHNEGRTMVSDIEVPGKWKRFWLVMFSGRNVLARVSQPVSLRTMADTHAKDTQLGQKLARVARTHFARLRYAVAGPKLASRDSLIEDLLKAPAIVKAINDEARSKKISKEKARKRAREFLNEIAADYREGLVRFADHLFSWLWNKLYNGIEVKNSETIRKLAQDGHEIIYLPCHRSHMDYLLLSYIIYKEGLVPPHIAAGINLNFFPVGTLFRRGGAFFIRRSFRGNKLYSTVFREYLTRLFQKGYAVEYYMEGGRSRTGRLLQPKTGMLAMTLQSQLRGVTRPITLVPVYVGYEHVMEVNTYHSELKGQSKQKESAFQVFKMLRKLRNFGHGYVTFGQPLRLSDYMDNVQPDWRNSVTTGSEEPAKPRWLTPMVNQLSDMMMRRINDSAALNSINLAALVLLASEQRSLTKEELIAQMRCYIELANDVPYNHNIAVPDWDDATLWEKSKRMDKFTITEDKAGEIVALSPDDAITLTYYRNNIIHLFIIPALVARYARSHQRFTPTEASDFISRLYPVLEAELFLSHPKDMLPVWVEALCESFSKLGWLEQSGEHYTLADRDSQGYVQLTLLASAAGESLARYAVVLELLQQSESLTRTDLERNCETVAQRLGARHGIETPEFYDKRLFSTLIGVLKESDYIAVTEAGDYTSDERTDKLSDEVDALLGSAVRQTIRQSAEALLKAN